MPLFDDYREPLKSEIADMINSPGRPAGAITAAMFLKEFVGDTPWAHLDIAGTAWADETRAVGAQRRHRRDGPHAGRAGAPDALGQNWPQRELHHGTVQPDAERDSRHADHADDHRDRPGTGAADSIDMIQVAVAAFGLTGVIMAAALVAGLLGRRALHLVSHAARRRRRSKRAASEHNFFRAS